MNNMINWDKYYNMVAKFQENYAFERFDENKHNLAETIIFRESLLTSEHCELLDAIFDKDEVEIADGLADISYVMLGTIWTFLNDQITYEYYTNYLKHFEKRILNYYTPKQFDEIFTEVHRSNMSKSCNTIDEVHATMAQEKYKDIKYTYTKKDNRYNIIVDEDFPEKELMKGKLLKSISYSPANLEFVKDYEKV